VGEYHRRVIATSARLAPPHDGAYRPAASGTGGVVTAAHGLAATAGLRLLLEGGNAVDAAVAVGAALSVVEPYMSGLGGGGGFMLIYDAATRSISALDYIGRTPAAADPSAFTDLETLGVDIRSSTVPGILGGWMAAVERFGSREPAAIFAPAIELAERGYPVSSFGARMATENLERLNRYPSSVATYLPDGRPPRVGSVAYQPALAQTYRELSRGGADLLYRGALGRRMVEAIQAADGWLTEADLAAFTPDWLEPLAIDYRGRRVHSVPPPSLGFQYLESLAMLEGFDVVGPGHNSADYLHLLLETIKLASADRTAYARAGRPTIEALLDPAYARERSTHVDREHAARSEGERFVADKTDQVAPGDPRRSARDHTTHFEVADRHGNLVAITQSNGAAFGNGFVAGDTGIVMNNFLYWTDLDPSSPSYLRPNGVRDSAMAPCIVTEAGEAVLGIGTPGSFGILQTTLQMLLNRLDFGLTVQAAIEAPRLRAFEGTSVHIESRIPAETRAALAARGHDVVVLDAWDWHVGGGQGVARDPDTGVLSAGADPRRDGQAVAI
jgi:gamma-glutamyltranspeptidase/glutathione hydrolase